MKTFLILPIISSIILENEIGIIFSLLYLGVTYLMAFQPELYIPYFFVRIFLIFALPSTVITGYFLIVQGNIIIGTLVLINTPIIIAFIQGALT